MNHSYTPTSVAHRHRGFTLVEIMVAVAVISILLYLLIQGLGGQQDTARASEVRSFFTSKVPAALTSYESSVGSTDSIDDKTDITAYGLNDETAWGDLWTVSTTGNATDGITIEYPIGGNRPDRMGNDLATFMTSNNEDGNASFPFIQDAQYNGGTLTVTINSF